jgi:hypothetical protein
MAHKIKSETGRGRGRKGGREGGREGEKEAIVPGFHGL